MSRFAPLPDPPYYAVTFASQRTEDDRGYDRGYDDMAEKMVALARRQPGFLGLETARDEMGFGMTVSYWQDAAAVAAWKEVGAHIFAQKLGKTRWYSHYTLRICRVERAYDGPKAR